MELDDLKSVWKKSPGFAQKTDAELSAMLRGRSMSIVAKIRRNVILELAFSFVASIALFIYALSLPNGALKSTAISIIVLFFIYSIYYYKKLILINRFDAVDNNLKQTLRSLINGLTNYLRFYRTSYLILYPIFFVLALLFGFIDTGKEIFLKIISQPKVLFYLGALALSFFFLGTWFTKWYLHKLYGMHVAKLAFMLKELEERESDSEN